MSKNKPAKKTLWHLLKRFELNGTVADTFFDSDLTPRFRHKNFYFLKPWEQTKLVRELTRFVVFDTETTGLNELGNDLPFEMTFIRFDLTKPGMIDGNLTVRINPADYLDRFTFDSSEILAITHVDVLAKEFREQCIPMKDAAEQILRFLSGTKAVFAHNGKFDANIMNNVLRNVGMYPAEDIAVFDSVEMMDVIYNKMAKVLYPAKNLDFILKCVLRDKIDEKARHTSEYDVKKTGKFLIVMKKFVTENEIAVPNDFARFDEFAKKPAMLGEEMLALDNRYYELERERKRLALGIRNYLKGRDGGIPDGWYVELGKDGRTYLKDEYKSFAGRYGYKLKRLEWGKLVPMYMERYGKDKESITDGLRAVHVSDADIAEKVALYDKVRKEKELVALSFKSLRKNAMKYMKNAENMSKGFAPNERQKHAVSDINFGDTGVYGQYEAMEDEQDYIPNSDAVISDVVSGKILEFGDLFHKIDYNPDPVVWKLS